MLNKLKIAVRVYGSFLGLIAGDLNNFLQIIFANIINFDFCNFQPLFRNLFIANIKLALTCERPIIYLK